MRLLTLFISFAIAGRYNCLESDSLEINEIETSPFYDAIIFSDIADIINEIGNNPNAQNDVSRDNESEGDDNIENLLSEYHKHLEKAHKQQKAYENSKVKNEMPLLAQERETLVKSNDYSSNNYNKDYYYRYPHSQHGSYSLYLPLKQKTSYVPNLQRIPKSNIFAYHDYGVGNKNSLSRTSSEFKPIDDWVQSKCYCKTNKIPCECNCKKCVSPIQSDAEIALNDRSRSILFNPSSSKMYQEVSVPKDNSINIKIKVSLSLQNLSQILYNNRNIAKDFQENESSERDKINIPLTYLDFPMPLDMFGNQKTMDSSTSLKTITHKKKKSRLNSNRRHRKKMITLHKILIQPHQLLDRLKVENDSNTDVKIQNPYNVTEKVDSTKTLNNTKKRGAENISLLINITNNDDEKITELSHVIANSIESEQIGKPNNISSQKESSIRLKRSLLLNDSLKVVETQFHTLLLNQTKSIMEDKNTSKIITNKKELFSKKLDKGAIIDEEYLLWTNTANKSTNKITKNITAIILEREKNKMKISISKETIRRNHTKALEQAIFGEVDWDDIDIIAPTFLSFVGKYLNGVITFCSTKTCHSMKCGNKICFHRICNPEERVNIKGHCAGSNSTDSITTLESIMDLPSNIGLEIVDILQDKMLGKLYGKATLCITKKCITFWASKKMFMKLKCLNKELDLTGHCKNTKQVKAI